MGVVRKKGRIKSVAGRNNGPARQRYWSSGRLRERKIKAIMKNDGCTRAVAMARWLDHRKGRIKK
jgi:hypothetical protein